MMKNVSWHVMRVIWLAAAISICGNALAGDISYNERFALDDNREAALKELIPGTEDYYYYHALHLELAGKLTAARKMIDGGVKKYRHSPRLRELENRYALKIYEHNPAYSLKYLIRYLNLKFNHRQKKLKKEVRLPTKLNPDLIAFDTLSKDAFKESRNTERFEKSAFDFLVSAQLTPDQRRNLLSRLRRPDYPGIVKLIIDDLNYKHSKGFWHHEVHGMLTVEQLKECLRKKPELIKQTNFINTYLTKLRPNDDVDWVTDNQEYGAYLKRLLIFIKDLPLAYNSLKANIIYKQLEFNIKKGIYDKGLFMHYVKMPRQVHYVNRKLLNRREIKKFHVDLHASYETFTSLPPIVNDEQLVRRHLLYFLKNAEHYNEFDEYIEHNYLKQLFAEVKLVNGIGDAENWYAIMDSPTSVKKLRDRIDIEILPTNNNYLELDEKVVLDIGLKNIKDLTIKVYEINTTAYYRQNLSRITTAIELDGLVPNSSRLKKYSQPPMHRHIESLIFPEITQPGVYIIELIGNGVSSRALVRKGRLTFTERIGAAGHVFMLYDGEKKLLTDGVLWMEGTEYQAEDGEILVPFSGSPKKQSIVFTNKGFSVLRDFQHLGENYKLSAGMYLGREQLVAGKKCTVTVRPELLLNGEPVDISLLENPVLTIRSLDLDGLAAEKQVNDFKLNNDKESIYTFRVPKRLRSMTIILSGKVLHLNSGKKIDLSVQKTVATNQIKETAKVEDVFLRHTAKRGYIAELLGRNGEPRDGRAVHLELKHRDFRRSIKSSLKTDTRGRVYLGDLADIDWVKVRGPEQTGHTWQMPKDRASRTPLMHMLAGDKLRIPIMHTDNRPLNRLVSLLETRGGVFVKDCISNIKQEGGYLIIYDLPVGDYSLMTKPDGKITTIRVTRGELKSSQLLGQSRVLEQRAAFPLQIQDIEIKKEDLVVQLANSVPGTRVHVAMTRYITDELFIQLGIPSFRLPRAAKLTRPKTQYLSGRRIGDEYRYVMERKTGEYPGNMLTRPSLLLNPWSPRSTAIGSDHAAVGEAYQKLPPGEKRGAYDEPSNQEGRVGLTPPDQFSSFDFLGDISPVVLNLEPDGRGVVTLPIDKLPVGQQLHVYAVNGSSVVYRQRSLPEHYEEPQDQRLRRYLDPKSHFTEQKRMSIVRKGENFAMADILSGQVEIIDSLSSAYRLMAALNDNATLAEFNFIIKWPEYGLAKKKELYKKYACHELHLFLAMKDPGFFNEVVHPYIANKKDATFIDDRLLGRQLDSYLEPWSYSRLNIVERVLLAQQMKNQHRSTSRHLKDLFDLLPPDIERFNRLFDSVLRSSGLEAGGGKLDMVINKAISLNEAMMERSADSIETNGSKALGGLAQSQPVITPMAASTPPVPGGKSNIYAKRKKHRLVSTMDKATPLSKTERAQSASQLKEQKKLRDLRRRETVRQLYRKLEKTREWVENNYYHKPVSDQVADLVKINAFWKDYANWDGKGGFLSGNLAEAGDSFTEILLALAVLDLPFQAGEHDFQYKDGGMVFTAASDVILFHKQVQKAEGEIKKSVLLINQSFFAGDDRYRFENNERFDKFVTGEFEKGRVYGCQLVITNPTSTRRKVDVLQQIPAGAIAVLSGTQTRSKHTVLEPYSTQSQEYYFYFPYEGKYPHYPVHVAENEELLGSADPFVFNVVSQVERKDKGSWEHVSQFGTEEEVIAYLDAHNVNRLNLEMIAWRMRDKEFFNKVTTLLVDRKVYNKSIWSYSLYHNVQKRIGEYLVYTPLINRIGKILESPLLDLDPVKHQFYEHTEYWPLVNGRVFKLGDKRKILNHQFYKQYESFLKTLTYRRALTDDDEMAIAVYMLLQDRIEEAMHFYSLVEPAKLRMRIQYDYLSAYMAFYRGTVDEAVATAAKYKDYPVDRWRDLFREVRAQGDEINGEGATVIDKENRSQTQTKLADALPLLQLDIEGSVLKVEHANLEECVVNYYPMNIELLFSRKPFVQDVGSRFTFIKPGHSDRVELDGDEMIEIKVPVQLRDQNLMIEVAGAGISRLKAYYPNALKLNILEGYGQLRVADRKSGTPLPQVYVKVYARTETGEAKFYKDGYTDLRGRFDYTSLNSDKIDSVSRFAILVLSNSNGAVVREVNPPHR